MTRSPTTTLALRGRFTRADEASPAPRDRAEPRSWSTNRWINTSGAAQCRQARGRNVCEAIEPGSGRAFVDEHSLLAVVLLDVRQDVDERITHLARRLQRAAVPAIAP